MEYSEEFKPQNCSQMHEEQYKHPKKAQKYVSGAKNGVWSDLEHTKYVVFMEFHKDKMRSKEKRRTNKLYKAMAAYIETRNPLQCRSHHQKLEEKYIYPNKIISYFKTHNDLTLYTELKHKLEEQAGLASSTLTQHLKLQEASVQVELQPEPVATSQSENSAVQGPSSPQEILLPEFNRMQSGPYGFLPMQPPAYLNWYPYQYFPFYPVY